jgi:hypothetical protein
MPKTITPALDPVAVRAFIQAAYKHYEQQQEPVIPPWFTRWLDDLYARSYTLEGLDLTPAGELLTLQSIYDFESGTWLSQPAAVNKIYKLFNRLGRDTAGMSDH